MSSERKGKTLKGTLIYFIITRRNAALIAVFAINAENGLVKVYLLRLNCGPVTRAIDYPDGQTECEIE